MTGPAKLKRVIATLLLLLCVGVLQPAGAQNASLIGYGEVAGDDVSLLLLQASVSAARPGLRPVALLQGYVVSLPSAVSGSENVYSVMPAFGLAYSGDVASLTGTVGYQIRTDERVAPYFGGDETGLAAAADVALRAASGIALHGIGQYNFTSEYLWTRALGTVRLIPAADGAIHLGGEYIWQGDLNDAQNYRSTQYGPVAQWVGESGFVAALGGGWKNDETEDLFGDLIEEDATWYAKVEMLIPLFR